MSARTLTDAQLCRLTLGAMNAGLKSYRPDLRYTRADAARFAELWNANKSATVASLGSVDGLPFVFVTDAPA